MTKDAFITPTDAKLKIKPIYTITMHNGEKQVGLLDFNGPVMTFTGDADESAKLFFDFIAETFSKRLADERMAEREACAKLCEKEYDTGLLMAPESPSLAAAIRARSQS